MKIGRLISAAEPNRVNGLFASRALPGMAPQGLAPEVSSGCVQSCVGATAAAQCAACGTNPDCWDNCAGQGKGECVLRCN